MLVGTRVAESARIRNRKGAIDQYMKSCQNGNFYFLKNPKWPGILVFFRVRTSNAPHPGTTHPSSRAFFTARRPSRTAS